MGGDAQDRAGGGDQLAAGGEAVLRRLRERPCEDVVEGGRQLRADVGEARRRVQQMGVQDRHVAVALEQPASGQALEQHASQRVDVGGRPRDLAVELLGRRVPEACRRTPARRRAAGAGGGDPEVAEERAAAGLVDEDVRRLDVAMHEAAGVDGIERRRELPADRQRPRRVECAGGADQLAEIAAVDVAHRDVQHAVLGAGVIDRDDARVVDRGDQPRLEHEALASGVVVGERGVEELQRHAMAQTQCRASHTDPPAPCPSLRTRR